jgi:hypothetical protein
MRRLLVVTSALLFVTNTATTGVFALMWYIDAVQVCEPNILIRLIELSISWAIAMFGLMVLLHCLKPTHSAEIANRGMRPQAQQLGRE